ncbi:pyruvate formate lyase-activating protein [Candidatus Bathyarchaeota archaeon]|nr:MAG: pyruvate formate lyase-activating protein [Candidatus Bathyarchaeota archaeon]
MDGRCPTLFWRPDALTVWGDEEVRRRLSWYHAVMTDEKPAKFIICKHTPIDPDIELKEAEEKELWSIHEKTSEEFRKIHEKIANGTLKLGELEKQEKSFLDLKIELVHRLVQSCRLCERRCGVNRLKGEKGFCRLDSVSRVSTWFHHFGEEAPLLGGGGHPVGGSGTIFFTSCNLRCKFCQNYDISFNPENGVEVDAKRLALIAKELRREGAANINYVGGEPTPNLHTIIESLKHLNVNVPLLWNSNMLCSEETMKILCEVIDIWLPDFKFGNNNCADRLTAGGIDYVKIVTRNHIIAHKNGDMIVRHLVMPNHLDCCTKPVLEILAKKLDKDRILVNIMGQWRPEYYVARHPEKYPELMRRVSSKEMREAFDYADQLGLVYKPVS